MLQTTRRQSLFVRSAQPGDIRQIEALLAAEDLDRSAFVLDDFVVAVDHAGQLAGCARLKQYDDGVELSSVAVHLAYRGQGVGTSIIVALLRRPRTACVHLMCEPAEVPYFARFGFVVQPRESMPPSLQAKFAMYEMKVGTMVVMQRES